MKDGFNLTRIVSVKGPTQETEIFVPKSDDEYELRVWLASEKEPIAVRIAGGPDGNVVAEWKGTHLGDHLRRRLEPGRYVIALGGGPGEVVVGVKGSVVGRCLIPADRITEHAAQPVRGFHWPYLLITPKTKPAATLLVLPNSGGFVSDDLELLRASAFCQARSEGALEMADRLGVSVLIPIFPRPSVPGEEDNLYVHALSRAALLVQTPSLARADLQLIAMIEDAHGAGRVLMQGFSAAGMFTNRFAVLHPERTLAAVVGSPGGWPIAPSPELKYPVGIGDVDTVLGTHIDATALRNVKFYFYLGSEDDNDSVPFRDSFSSEDEALIMRRFGKTPVARWGEAKKLYDLAGMNASFKLYPGVGHNITPSMRADILAFFAAALDQRTSTNGP